MVASYLWVNALLYAVIAGLCAIKLAATSQSMGFLSRDRGGLSGFLTVFGGMELGLALLFAGMA